MAKKSSRLRGVAGGRRRDHPHPLHALAAHDQPCSRRARPGCARSPRGRAHRWRRRPARAGPRASRGGRRAVPDGRDVRDEQADRVRPAVDRGHPRHAHSPELFGIHDAPTVRKIAPTAPACADTLAERGGTWRRQEPATVARRFRPARAAIPRSPTRSVGRARATRCRRSRRWPSSSARRRPASTPGWPTPTRPSCAPTTGTGGASTRSSSHPSWHWLMRHVGRLGAARRRRGSPAAASGAHVARAAGFYLMNQLENGHCCPISMTYAAVPALRLRPASSRSGSNPGCGRSTTNPALADPEAKAGPARRHVDDRDPGRVGPAGGRDAGRAARRTGATG